MNLPERTKHERGLRWEAVNYRQTREKRLFTYTHSGEVDGTQVVELVFSKCPCVSMSNRESRGLVSEL